jgi:hypothetical protein
MGQGPRTRDLQRRWKLTWQPGPSPQRAPWPPLARVSQGPQVQSSCQAQRAGSSLGLHPWKWMRRTPPPPGRARTVQRLVYFISEVLHEAKARYLEVHKLFYVVLIASRKLCHYFQAHRISVVTSYPLRAILRNPNATGNIAKWAAELRSLNWISYRTMRLKASVGQLHSRLDTISKPPRGGRMIVSQSSELRSSLDPTRLFSSMAPRISRGPARG